MLWIHRHGLSSRDAEEVGVEIAGVDESSSEWRRLARARKALQIPTAIVGKLRETFFSG
jgi:hypothetical protein